MNILSSLRRAVGGLLFCMVLSALSYGQTLTLSGTVSDTAAHAVPSATVWAKRLKDGKMFTSRSNGDGAYVIADMRAGDYKVWAKAGELEAAPVKVTLSAGQTTDLVVSPVTKPIKK
ncbi:MAG TPA: carboxypeptidase-like regulatory domain-containing protein [Terracidiphilus sp.]|jgi:hypothetical protein|nr:carboxypeptidase-like regulatory domain-containing protein [Terracidiphilus sp.]